MKRKFTFLITAAVMLLVFIAIPMGMMGQTTTLVSGSGTSGYVVPAGWTSSGTVEGGSYLKFDNGTITSPEFAPHNGLSFTYTVATFGSGTNHPLTIRILNASTNAVIIEETTDTPTSSSYISTESPLSLGDIDVAFKIQMYGPTGKGVRLRDYSVTGTPAGSTPTTYTVTFDDGAGTFVGNADFPNTTNQKVAGTYALPDATRANYTLLWSDGTDTYEAGDDYEVTEDVDFTAQWTESGGGSATTEHVYNFAGANNFYTDANLTTHPSSGSGNNVGTIYYSDGSVFVASGTSRYFSSASSGYFMLGKTGAQISLPTFEGYKITQVKVHSSSGHSTSVSVSIVSGSNTASAAKTWSTQNHDYVYDIAEAYQTSALSLNVTNNYNSQFTSITIECEQLSTDPIINATDPEALAYNATGGEFSYSITNPTEASLTATSNSTWITNVAVDGTNSKVTFSTSTNTAYTQRTGTITLTYTGATDKVITITQNAAPTPTITAADVNIEYNATDGSIAYTINNVPTPAGTLTAAIKSGTTPTITDFAIGTVTNNTVPFTCSANTTLSAHTATVTLTYTYGDNQTTTKDVVVTQAGNPDAYDNISSINSENTSYTVRGTVLAVSARAFVLGDGTGYVYYYNGYSAPSVSVGNKKIVQGTTTSYGHVIQFPSSATITPTETSNYNNTPAATVITQIPDYTSGLHLSDYFQFEGTLTKSNGYYYVSCGANNINISYPSSTQQTTMNALENKTVRVKGYFAGINSSDYFSVILESVEEVVNPTLSIEPATAADFTYVVGSGPSAEQVFEVTGTNLTSANITAAITAGTSYFEITDDTEYSNSVTISSGDAISIRLKAGLAKGSYEGTLTLSTEGASNVEVALNGSVTGQTYAINIDNEITGGTIEADLTTAEAGATVTLTATPDAAYNFSAWVVEDENENPISVTDNQFEMPASDVLVTATFALKDTYVVTCAVTPNGAAQMEASPASAYEGQTVTLSYVAETGYTLSSIVITKTSDGSATGITPTASGDDFTFTMPGYAVTATATFLSDTYFGSFVLFEGTIVEGDYVIVKNDKAVKNTISSSRLTSSGVSVSNNIISDPSSDIVWHIAPSATDGYWAIYNAKIGQYISNSKASDKDIVLVNTTNYNSGAIWSIDGTTTHELRSKNNIDNGSSNRYLGQNGDYFASYTSSYDHDLLFYKYTVLTERTITFNGNGGTYNDATTYTQTVYDGIATNLDANQFTKANSVFAGWALTADGDIEYADQAEVTINANLTLYAKWNTSYTAMADDPIVGGTVLINGEEIVEAAEGTEMTLTQTPALGYAFSAWNVYKADDETTKVTVTENTFTMPAYDVIVSATFVEVTTYSLITNVSQIVSGKHYIIVGKKNDVVKAMGYDKGNNRHAVVVTETNSTIPETDGVYEFVINGPIVIEETNYYTIYDTNENSTGYLFAPVINSNYLRTQETNDDKGLWTIGINGTTSEATIRASKAGGSGRNLMQYNASSTIFSCYSSNQDGLYLYVKVNDNDLEYYGTEIAYAGTSIPADETITIGTGSVMTVPAGFTNDDPANLIIEDGGQLITSSTGVQATVKKDIEGAGDENWAAASGANSWYFIASPVDDAYFSTATVDNYDLYLLDWANNYWRNLKNNENESLFANGFQRGTGYLYASKDGNTISVAGEIQPLSNDDNATVTLANDGWNLIGNPLTCKVTVDHSFGLLNNGSAIDYTGTTVNPFQGIVVWGNVNDEVTFTKAATQNAAAPGNSSLQMTVAQNVVTRGNTTSTTIDNAVVSFNESSILPKFNMLEGNAKLYIPQGNEEYAIVSSEAQGEMPVNFKAAQNGTYTLSIEAENVEMDYLHLIDNMTGADVDLLQTPSYTFTGKTTDYASRFRLVFSANSVNDDSTSSETFAFVNGEEIVITNAEADATLQVVDMTGRILVNTKGANRLSTAGMTPGVYVIRMVNGEKVKTQKIVVR